MNRSSRRAGAVRAALTGLTAAFAVLAGLAVPTASAVPATSSAPGSVTSAAVPATTHEPDDDLPVVLDVNVVNPQVLRPGDDLTVGATIRNTGSATIEEPRVLLHLDRSSFISRTSLDRWRTAGPDAPVGQAVAELDLEEPLPPGASVTASVTLPADRVGLRRGVQSWGPRGVALQVVDRADPARRRQGLVRTFAVWFPVEEVTPTRLTLLVPLVGPALDPYDTEWVGELEELTAEDGRLDRVLAATAGHPEVTWVVDPWLVDVGTREDESPDDDVPPVDETEEGADGGTGDGGSDGDATDEEETGGDAGEDDEARDGGEDGTVPPDAAPEETSVGFGPVVSPAGAAARGWVTRLLDRTTGRDVELLPYLDPDLAALSHAGDEDRLRLAQERAEEVAADTDLPDGARAALAWPAEALPDLSTAAFATRNRERAVVVAPGEMPAPSVLTYTPSGRTTVSSAEGDVTVLIPDARLSAAVRVGSVLADPLGEPVGQDAAGPDDSTEEETQGTEGTDEAVGDDISSEDDGGVGAPADDDGQRTPALLAQDILAELAVITRERPSDSRHLLVTVPRDWSPEVAQVQAQLAAITSAPWVRTESVSGLVGAPETGVDRGSLPNRSLQDVEIPSAELAAVQEAVTERRRLASMVADPDALLGDAGLEVLAPVSVAWRTEPVGRTVLVSRAEAATQALRNAVSVQPGATINLISASGGLPIRVENSLPQEVTVEVILQPGDTRLRADDSVTTAIPPGGQRTVQVPVHAIQSADVDVTVQLWTLDGELIEDATVMLVRVRADWEGIGTAVIAGLLALGLVVGLIRTIRRGRTTGRRAHPQPASGPDALSPEAVDASFARGGAVGAPLSPEGSPGTASPGPAPTTTADPAAPYPGPVTAGTASPGPSPLEQDASRRQAGAT
jgi:hypothetical protein